MKRLITLVAVLVMAALPMTATAGDFHVGGTLICSDCHVMHYSQTHAYTVGGLTVPLGTTGPYTYLLRNEVNEMCLTCHDNQSFAPDVFGQNTGNGDIRLAGGLNAHAGHMPNDLGYDEIDGHTLWSPDDAPGDVAAYTPPTHGLECTNCHAQHGSASQYRNLLNRGIFTGKNMTYAIGTNDGTKDMYERAPASYDIAQVDYNEPSITASAYANWCKSCHVNFHGASGGPELGGQSGGTGGSGGVHWVRHPSADVNIGTPSATFISSLAQFNSHVNRVKVMDSQGLWDGTAADNTVTPSCFSCHKSHGNKNGFGMIHLKGDGVNPVTEEGDGGLLKDLCRQCHVQG